MAFKLTKQNLLIIKKISKVIENRKEYKKELYLSLLKEKIIQSKMSYFYMIFWISIGLIFLGTIGTLLVSLTLFIPLIKNILEVNQEIKKAAGNIYFYEKILSEHDFNILNELLDFNKKDFEYLSSKELENIILKKYSKKNKFNNSEFCLLLDSNLGEGYQLRTSSYTKIINNFFEDKDLLTIMFKENINDKIEMTFRNFLNNENNDIKEYIISKYTTQLIENFKYDSNILNEFIIYLCKNYDNNYNYNYNYVNKLDYFFEIINKKYIADNIFNILYGDKKLEEEKKLYQIIQNNPKFKYYLIKKSNEVFNEIDIFESFKYKDYISNIEDKKIIKKILKSISLYNLVKICFSTNEFKSENEQLILNYINNLDAEKLIYFKKEIVKNVLKNKKIDDIQGSEIEFFNFADNLNIDKEALFILKEKFNKDNLIKIEELKEIKIINI